MKELFRTTHSNAPKFILPEAKTRPEDYPPEYVEQMGIDLDEAIARQAAKLSAETRKSVNLFETGRSVAGSGGQKFTQRRFKNRVSTLKNLSESAIPSRAISIVRGGIGNLEYIIRPKNSNLKPTEVAAYEKSIQTVRKVIDTPNATDDNLSAFLGQIVEDILVFDAGCFEYVPKPKFSNGILSLEVVPGYSIAQSGVWQGDPKAIRWAQVVEGVPRVHFRDEQLEYIMMRKRSWTPHGFSKLETAMEILDAFFSVSSFQRATASEAFPPFLVWLGDNVGDAEMRQMRSFWDMELKGRGTPAFWANTGKPEVISLKPHTDDGLFLKYTELLIRVIAFVFDLKPQDFGIERDVNRSTAEVAQSASVAEAVKPLAQMIAAKCNTRVLPKIAEITGDEKILELEFFWSNVDPRDLKQESEIIRGNTEHDILKMDEARAMLDLPPLPNGIGQLSLSAYREVVKFNPELAVDEVTRKLLFGEDLEKDDGVDRDEANVGETESETDDKKAVENILNGGDPADG